MFIQVSVTSYTSSERYTPPRSPLSQSGLYSCHLHLLLEEGLILIHTEAETLLKPFLFFTPREAEGTLLSLALSYISCYFHHA